MITLLVWTSSRFLRLHRMDLRAIQALLVDPRADPSGVALGATMLGIVPVFLLGLFGYFLFPDSESYWSTAGVAVHLLMGTFLYCAAKHLLVRLVHMSNRVTWIDDGLSLLVSAAWALRLFL